MPLSLRLAACGLAGCGCAATATGPLDPRAMGLAQLLGLKISLRAASGSEIGVNRGKSAQAGYTGYTGYMGYMGYTGYTGYVQSKGVYGVYA